MIGIGTQLMRYSGTSDDVYNPENQTVKIKLMGENKIKSGDGELMGN
jgi:hypothetical protein